MRYGLLSPKVDFVFKKIFGNEKHPEILISFLNAVMKPKNPIKSVKIKNSDIDKEHVEDKYSRLDGYRLKEMTTNEELTDIQEIHFIELPKMRESNENAEVTDMLEAWIKFTNNPSSEVVKKLEMSVHEIKEAKDELIRLSGDKKEVELYEQRKFAILDRVSDLENAEEKGKEIGKQEGLKEGLKKGKIAVAKNLLDVLDVETIAIKTGLSVEEVKKLKLN